MHIFKEVEAGALKEYRDCEDNMGTIKYNLTRSSASCKLDDIKSFIYGGFSSRFWMLRKHINCLTSNEFKNAPFKSWNCITLRLERRDVDLVIEDEF